MHKTPDLRKVVAVCDKEILGKKFEEGKLQLDVNEHFYKGEEKAEEEIVRMLRGANAMNFTGEKAVALGVREGFIDKKHILRVKGIPHAQAVMN